jgi:hypothetical protein
MSNKDTSPNTKAEKTMVEQTTQSTSIAHVQSVGAPDEPIRRFIRAIAEGERVDTEKWLSTLDKLYDGWKYSSSQRIAYTVPILNEEQKTWYAQKTSSGNNAHQQRQPSKFTRSNRRSNNCFKCGTPGPYARDCTRSHFQ